jgi:hypothetical protein
VANDFGLKTPRSLSSLFLVLGLFACAGGSNNETMESYSESPGDQLPSPTPVRSPKNSPTPAPSNLPASCYVAGAQRPSSLCGRAGYSYLLATYVRPQCGGCHYEGSAIHFNPFADRDDNLAYNWGSMMSAQLWTERVTKNPLIYSYCNLRSTDSIYKDLQDWLKCQ